MRKIKKRIPIILAVLLLIISVFFLIYPTISNTINSAFNQSSIRDYNNNVSTLSTAEKEKYLSEAQAYNKNLSDTVTDAFSATAYKNVKPSYESVMNFSNGQICSLEIPKINLSIAVYHGTSEDVLNYGAAHSANTSIPIGGADTHAVVSAHTAYPGKVFFDNLTELQVGDIFYINVLDEKLAYKVNDINIVEPDDTSRLQIVYGKDLVTLVTCTPYAINTHRLLVTGERIINNNTSTPDKSVQTENNNYTLFILAPCIALVVLGIITKIIIKKRKD